LKPSFFRQKPDLYFIHILVITAKNLQRHLWKKAEIHSSPCKHLPVLLAAGSRSLQLEADFLSGEETQFLTPS
jgi:alpha-beta hydrolase superfamily lysophospholipase